MKTKSKNPKADSAPQKQDIVKELRELLGLDTVLIPITRGKKTPSMKGWPELTVEKMSDAAYLKKLATGNIGVLLGKPSNGLCSIDIDDDAEIEPFLSLNPKLQNTLRTRGARGGNVWVQIVGKYPHLTPLDRELTSAAKEATAKWGEWRSTGGQTVIQGKHPSGCDYQIIQNAKPVAVAFDEIVWPDYLRLPWDFGLYRELVGKQGEPYYKSVTGAIQLNQPFFVTKFAVENELLHEPKEKEFFEYADDRGLWVQQSSDSIKRRIGEDLKRYADSQSESGIERKRTNALLTGLSELLRGEVEKKNAFGRHNKVIHLANGMLHLDVSPPELREFSPSYLSRNQRPVNLVEGADCPRFKNELLASALDADDISLLQRWCGSLLLGGNLAHRIMLLRGTAGGGKSTLVEIVERIVGLENVVELRTEYLAEKFELFRYIGKTLLTGKDVPAEFMMRKGASTLKKLVGHDLLTAEGKNKNGGFEVLGAFDVVITCNSNLKVRLEGDAPAWRRRLLIIDYDRPKAAKRICDFASVLFKEESSGILLWMIEGAIKHLKELSEVGDFKLTKKQEDRVERLLAESDSVREFVRICVQPAEPRETITVEELVSAYQAFCTKNDWHPAAPTTVEKQLPDLIAEFHGVGKRNDISRDEGTKRGFKGLQCDTSNL